MPTYDYECSKCGKIFEHFQSMTSPHLTDCPDEACGGKQTLKRLIGSGAGIIFKGSGFYETDYKNKSAPSTSSDSGKSDDSAKKDAPKKAAAPACGCGSDGKCPLKS